MLYYNYTYELTRTLQPTATNTFAHTPSAASTSRTIALAHSHRLKTRLSSEKAAWLV